MNIYIFYFIGYMLKLWFLGYTYFAVKVSSNIKINCLFNWLSPYTIVLYL